MAQPIDTLGELKASYQDDSFRLVVLGGYGNSDSTQEPVITHYANNDGWFDDVSDGLVTAEIRFAYLQKYPLCTEQYKDLILNEDGTVNETIIVNGEETPIVIDSHQVDIPAWAIVGFPRYVPEILDMITMNDVIYDIGIRYFASEPCIYGIPPFDTANNSPKTPSELRVWRQEAQWNLEYYTKFYREIWPILKRPAQFRHVFNLADFAGSAPHNTGTGGTFSEAELSQTPANNQDPFRQKRQHIYKILR